MTGPSLIDDAVLDDLVAAIGNDGARSVIELFLGESRGYLATIVAAAAQPNDTVRRDQARRAAHALKSSAGQIGAAALSANAAGAERAAAEGGAELPQRATALAECAAATAAALTRLLAGA